MSGVDRDVSGFAAPPPKKRPTPPDKEPASEAEPATSVALTAVPNTESARPPRRRPTAPRAASASADAVALPPVRVSVHVPTASAERLRDVTDNQGQTQAEVVFDAQLAHGDDLEQEVLQRVQQRGGVPPRTRRRRTNGPSTQLGLSMSPPEAQALKDAAAACHHTLSAHVTELLDRFLDT